MEKAGLSLVWWNTSLSPPLSSKRGKASILKLDQICAVLDRFMRSNFDFICLGEVCDEDIDYIIEKLKIFDFDYQLVKAASKLSRSYFDTCIIYKSHHLLIPVYGESAKYLSFTSGTNLLKTATRFLFQLSKQFNEETLMIYLCHWPSKLRNADIDVSSISQRCRMDVEIQNENVKNIILMGDFNLEPFETPILHYMQTSRSKEIVLEKPRLLYNPFWKFLFASPNDVKGTYHYSGGRFHKDLILDQMIFSSSFLSDPWGFSDDLIEIIDVSAFGGGKGIISDHRPIVGVIERKIL